MNLGVEIAASLISCLQFVAHLVTRVIFVSEGYGDNSTWLMSSTQLCANCNFWLIRYYVYSAVV